MSLYVDAIGQNILCFVFEIKYHGLELEDCPQFVNNVRFWHPEFQNPYEDPAFQ